MRYGRRRGGRTSRVNVKSRGYRPSYIVEYSLVDAWARQGRGDTQFEKAVDGVARSMNIFFDAYQYYVPLTVLESTRIDFVLWQPKPTAIYADGIQHELRPDTAEQDMVRRNELYGLGWEVVVITETEFLQDPQGAVSKILFV